MNEFERQLSSIEPATGRSDVMQIMYLAGQQSVQGIATPASGSGGSSQPGANSFWKFATGVMTAACLVLASSLFWVGEDATENSVADSGSTETGTTAVEDASASPEIKQSEIEIAEFEAYQDLSPNLDDPKTWASLGPRVRQLRQVTNQGSGIGIAGSHGSDGAAPLTPFAFDRARQSVDEIY